MQGRKPNLFPNLRVVEGGPGQAPAPRDAEPQSAKRKLKPSCALHGEALKFWKEYVETAPWLVAPFDEPLATTTALLWAQWMEKPDVSSAKIRLLRAHLADCGFDPGTRKRLWREKQSVPRKGRANKYFDDAPDRAV